MSRDTFDVENSYVRRIQQMRSEVLAFNEGREHSYGPISHALEILPNFSRSASDWSTDHLCRFHVVITDEHPDEPMFPAQYMPADEDKTLKAISEDGFFLSIGERFPLRSLSTKLHSAFFMDLQQITAEDESVTKNENSAPISEPNASNSRDELKTAIVKALHYAKGLAHPETVSFLSHSLIHNFLKYVASMEHLAYPDQPFWCPSADSEAFSIDAAGVKFSGHQDGAVYTWARRSTKNLKRNSIPLCFIECKKTRSGSSEDTLAREAADLIALGALNWRAVRPAFRPREKRTLLHISAAIVTEDYLAGIAHDSLSENQYLPLIKGQVYDLSEAIWRSQAVKQILGLMRYLTRFPLPSGRS